MRRSCSASPQQPLYYRLHGYSEQPARRLDVPYVSRDAYHDTLQDQLSRQRRVSQIDDELVSRDPRRGRPSAQATYRRFRGLVAVSTSLIRAKSDTDEESRCKVRRGRLARQRGGMSILHYKNVSSE